MTSNISVYVYDELDPVVRDLAKDFEIYKRDYPVNMFGRDDVYTWPNDIVPHEIYHVHLLSSSNPTYRFRDPYYRVSDRALVYTRGKTNRSAYLLIAVLEPPAHEKAYDDQLMRFFGAIAKGFRLEH